MSDTVGETDRVMTWPGSASRDPLRWVPRAGPRLVLVVDDGDERDARAPRKIAPTTV